MGSYAQLHSLRVLKLDLSYQHYCTYCLCHPTLTCCGAHVTMPPR